MRPWMRREKLDPMPGTTGTLTSFHTWTPKTMPWWREVPNLPWRWQYRACSEGSDFAAFGFARKYYWRKKASVICGFPAVDLHIFKHAVAFSGNFLDPDTALSIHDLTFPYNADWHYLRAAVTGAECENLRDKVYGMLSKMASFDTGPLEVNYDLEVPEVYTTAAKRHIQYRRRARILLECQLEERRLEGFPSWVPDWSTCPKTRGTDFIPRATGWTLTVARFPEPGVVGIAGVLSSRVTAVATAVPAGGCSWPEYADKAAEFLRENEIEPFQLAAALIGGGFGELYIPPTASRMTFAEVRRAARAFRCLSESQLVISADVDSLEKMGVHFACTAGHYS